LKGIKSNYFKKLSKTIIIKIYKLGSLFLSLDYLVLMELEREGQRVFDIESVKRESRVARI